MKLYEWVKYVLQFPVTSDIAPYIEFMVALVSCVLLVISFTCALSLFIGIAFAIFRR